MTDKVQKFRKEVEKLKSNLIYGACSSQIAMETRCKEEAYNEVLAILDTMQEEPVSEDFEKALAREWHGYNDRGAATVDALEDNTQELAFAKGFYRGAKWQKKQMMANAVEGVVHHFEKCKVASVHYNDPTGVPMAYFTSPEGLSAGDKVKINVIKED